MTTLAQHLPKIRENSGEEVGFLVGFIGAVLLGGLFLAYGLPAIRDAQERGNPAATIQVPDTVRIDFN